MSAPCSGGLYSCPGSATSTTYINAIYSHFSKFERNLPRDSTAHFLYHKWYGQFLPQRLYLSQQSSEVCVAFLLYGFLKWIQMQRKSICSYHGDRF